VKNGDISRRDMLNCLGFASAAFALRNGREAIPVMGQDPVREKAIESFTGPGPNPHWNSVGPYVTEPQKSPLILLTDRPVQLETPRSYFRTIFTPNDAFYVRWHLEGIPNAVDLRTWKLRIEGNVKKPLVLGLPELIRNFKPISVAATNQCSGNSRSRLQPRVPGAQWGQWRHGECRVDGRASARVAGVSWRQRRIPPGPVSRS
jgi:sulfite oxidase